jgi:hypothetical protein
MMCIGDRFAVICLDSIRDPEEKLNVTISLKGSGKEIIEISLEQMNKFAGNMLQVTNAENESLLVMSEQAYLSLNTEQIAALEHTAESFMHHFTRSKKTVAVAQGACWLRYICRVNHSQRQVGKLPTVEISYQ